MTPEQFSVIDALRAKGWTVVLFSPEELQGVKPDRLEMRLEDYGCDLIGEMAPDEEWLWSPDDDCPTELEHTNREDS
jgi:hypothetical protein